MYLKKSKREKFFFVTEIMLFLGIIGSLSVEIFKPECICIRVLPILLSMGGSCSALCIPYNFVKKFQNTDWSGDDNKGFTLTIPKSEHGFSEGANAVVYVRENNMYSAAICDIELNENLDILVNATEAFSGKIIIN